MAASIPRQQAYDIDYTDMKFGSSYGSMPCKDLMQIEGATSRRKIYAGFEEVLVTLEFPMWLAWKSEHND
jgi:hypothetical protein